MGLMVVLSVILMQVTRNLSDAWLAHWVSANTTQNTTNDTEFYLEIYASIAAINSVITLVRAFLFAYAGIKAAKFIHNKLLTCVFYVSNKMFIASHVITNKFDFRQSFTFLTLLHSEGYLIDFHRTHTQSMILYHLF